MAETPLSPPGTEVVAPYLTKRNRYKPKVGDKINVEIPGEHIRAEIKGVSSEDVVLVELPKVLVSRSAHGFLGGGLYPAKRTLGDHDVEVWKAVSEVELQQQEAQARFEAEQRAIAEQTEYDRVAMIRARDLGPKAEIPHGIGAPATPVIAEQHRRVLGPRRNRVTRSA